MLLALALLLVGVSLFVSNQIVSKVAEREKERAEQWADAIRKKIELVQLTNSTFSKLRENERKKMEVWIEATKEVSRPADPNMLTSYEFPLKIISANTDIPVIVLDNDRQVSGFRNLTIDSSYFRKIHPDVENVVLKKFIEDSLIRLAETWSVTNPSFTIEVYEGLHLSYYYKDSKAIEQLEQERDSLIRSFNNDLISNERLVPVILIDAETKEVIGTNVEDYAKKKSKDAYLSEISGMNKPIVIDFKNGKKTLLYYANSQEIIQLRYFPYIQFSLIGLLAFIAYLIFSTYRKAEQNQVWAGMAKETAHQLGTPLSSLMAWVSLLESQGTDPMITSEMQKDIERLDKITDRFSKIGSGAQLDHSDIQETVENVVAYLRPRISDKVTISVQCTEKIEVKHNGPLMEWVIENICKNGVDAMEGVGNLSVKITKDSDWVYLDIKDTGKGIPQNQYKTIFSPGFSTKKRGWGLGLSLVKRIVKEYHHGKVFVLESQLNQGTTFRISLPL